jgi:hypothetical protein
VAELEDEVSAGGLDEGAVEVLVGAVDVVAGGAMDVVAAGAGVFVVTAAFVVPASAGS